MVKGTGVVFLLIQPLGKLPTLPQPYCDYCECHRPKLHGRTNVNLKDKWRQLDAADTAAAEAAADADAARGIPTSLPIDRGTTIVVPKTQV